MGKFLNFQASFFGNFDSIKYDTETIKKFLSSFSSYTPKPIPFTSIDIRTNRLVNDNRLQLVSRDNSFFITFLPERIDLTFAWREGSSEKNEPEELKNIIIQNINLLKDLLIDVSSNRLAASCNLLFDYDKEKINNIILQYSNRYDFFEKKETMLEWQIRYNYRMKLLFNGKEEESNHIIDISIPQIKDLQNSLFFLIDINTNPENIDLRFSLDDLNSYIEEATKKIKGYFNRFKNE